MTALLVCYAAPLAAVQLPNFINRQTGMQAAVPAVEIARLHLLLGVWLNNHWQHRIDSLSIRAHQHAANAEDPSFEKHQNPKDHHRWQASLTWQRTWAGLMLPNGFPAQSAYPLRIRLAPGSLRR